jgi:Xaa-Pro aminopeptidase
MSFIYSIGEIRRRRERAQELMREQGLDALLLTNDGNLIYFVGLPTAYGLHRSNDRPGVAVLPSQGDPICVVAANMASIIRPVVRSECMH